MSITDAEKLEAIRNELAHAEANGHHLSGDCQGVGPGQIIPAVRIDYLKEVLGT